MSSLNLLTTDLRVFMLGALLLASGCRRSDDAANPIGGTGGLGLQLKLSPEVTISTINYQLTREQDFVRSGTFVPASDKELFSGFVGGLPPGAGYRMALDANAMLLGSVGTTRCSGAASFGITRGETTTVALRMRCDGVTTDDAASPTAPGGNACPSISVLRAKQAAAPIGAPLAVEGEAIDPDHQPAALSFRWSAPSGVFSSVVEAVTTFTCTKAGPISLALVVADGDADCPFEQSTLQVVCEDPSGAALAAGSGSAGAWPAAAHGGAGAAPSASGSPGSAGTSGGRSASAAGHNAPQPPLGWQAPPQAGRAANRGQRDAGTQPDAQAGGDADQAEQPRAGIGSPSPSEPAEDGEDAPSEGEPAGEPPPQDEPAGDPPPQDEPRGDRRRDDHPRERDRDRNGERPRAEAGAGGSESPDEPDMPAPPPSDAGLPGEPPFGDAGIADASVQQKTTLPESPAGAEAGTAEPPAPAAGGG